MYCTMECVHVCVCLCVCVCVCDIWLLRPLSTLGEQLLCHGAMHNGANGEMVSLGRVTLDFVIVKVSLTNI